MKSNNLLQPDRIIIVGRHLLNIHRGRVTAPAEAVVVIEYIGQTAGHARGKIAPGTPQADNPTGGHIFTAMVTGSFNHRRHAGVTDTKPLSGTSGQKSLTSGRAIKHGVAND